MNHELLLLHRPGPERLDPETIARFSDSFSFETCMRHILLVPADEMDSVEGSLQSDDEIYRGEDAYRFLLEVTCGLHSPLIGETEVYGQLKNKVAAFRFSSTPWSANLRRVFRSLFEDAKLIREKHLKDLGSQSYGSVLRREVKDVKRVHFLGAGHLVQEILPWLAKDGTEIHVHCRRPEFVRDVLRADVFVHELAPQAALQAGDVLVVAAPVSAEWIDGWLESVSGLHLVADLRSDSHIDRIAIRHGRRLELGEMMTRISANQAVLLQRKKSALDYARALAAERSLHTEYRPFGWEDVCA